MRRRGRKKLIEYTLALDLTDVKAAGALRRPDIPWVVRWEHGESIGYQVESINGEPDALRVSFSDETVDGPVTRSQKVPFTRTVCGDGLRLWFSCPGCGRRCRKLYLPESRVVCRVCGNLDYEDRQCHRCPRYGLFKPLWMHMRMPYKSPMHVPDFEIPTRPLGLGGPQ